MWIVLLFKAHVLFLRFNFLRFKIEYKFLNFGERVKRIGNVFISVS